MMRYLYTHKQTEGATGYFSCEPDPVPEMPDALRHLAEHPLDDFMRHHLLDRMSGLGAAQAAEFLRQALVVTLGAPAIQALLLELALLCPWWKEEEALFAGAAELDPLDPQSRDQATSLPLLRMQSAPDGAAQARWSRLFADNILHHRALPDPGHSDLPPLYPFLRRPPAEGPTGLPQHPVRLPGLSAPFTAPFPVRISDIREGCADTAFRQDSARTAEPFRARAARTAEPFRAGAAQTAEPFRAGAAQTAALALERLSAAGILAGAEMRHTASLSPIALLRPWHVRVGVRAKRHSYALRGVATAYGRGLSLEDARASCLMEIVERASAYLSIENDGIQGLKEPCLLLSGSRSSLQSAGYACLDPAEYPMESACTDVSLTWMPASGPNAKELLVPVQMASLFCNLDEIALFDSPSSTGLASACSVEEAKLAALLEILERDAEATSFFSKERCFTLRADPAHDPLIAALLADYAARGVNVQFQDITGPMGVPAYTCFVMSPKGVIAKGQGAHLSSRRAVVAALTETPYPYPDGSPSGPLLRKLPARDLHLLPDYSLPTAGENLALLEELLVKNHRPPLYATLTRADLDIPVVKAFIPGLELNAAGPRVPLRLYAKYIEIAQE